MQPVVYVFEGTGYFSRPGLAFKPEKVAEGIDSPMRPVTSKDWKRIEKWLIKRGYRQLCNFGRRHDGAIIKKWWGLVSVFGEPECHEVSGVPKAMTLDQVRARLNALVEAERVGG